MAWYNIFSRKPVDTEEKLNPAQLHDANKVESTRESTISYERAYEDLEIVNRAVNMIVDDTAEIPTKVLPIATRGVVKGIKRAKVETLLNKEPNPYQDINTFRRNLITDFLIDGNIFIYFDGAHMYHLPADKVRIHADKDTYIEKYTLHDTEFSPREIIHVKENSFHSIYRGVP
jgi:phage portal protein BeeE